MFKMQLIRNQKGAGMYLAMAATAALGGAAFLMGDMFINAEDVLKKDSRVISYQLLVDTVRKNLYAGDSCTAALTASPVNLTNALDLEVGVPSFSRGVELSNLPIKLDTDTINLAPNWKAKTGTSIKSMRLIVNRVVKLPDPFSGDRIIRHPAGQTLKAADMYLVIEPDHKGINVWSKENEKYWIKLYTYFDATTKQVHSCYDPTSEAIFCTETMKGVFVNDPSIPASARCKPDMGCFTFGGGLVQNSVTCPTGAGTDYKATQISSGFKTCTWCPSTPYDVGALQGLVGNEDFQDISDLDVLDCSASDPYAGLSAQEAWENFSYYQHLRNQLTPEQQAQYAGCLNHEVPCWDNPNTCQNECGGAGCNCVTGIPDDPNTPCNECTDGSCTIASPTPTPTPMPTPTPTPISGPGIEPGLFPENCGGDGIRITDCQIR